MHRETPPESPLFGYLTVVDDPAHGSCGGYLVLNEQGRPIEFHCTAPVTPSRAQQILYGPTLRASLYGEQVGPALIEKAKSPVSIVLVNQPECLELQHNTGQPVVLIDEARSGATGSASAFSKVRGTGIASGAPQLTLFPELLDEIRLISTEGDEEIERLLELLARSIDLAEPFERIREAIFEAQQVGGEGQGSDERAA
ncbi:MAG: hypothetical protein WD851_20215 [Pirellulales bacterium]